MQLKQYPFYLKITVILLGLVLFFYILVTLSGVLIPFSFALVIAILLNPLVNRFKKMGLNHVLSIAVTLLIAFTIISSIVYFLSSQIIGFGENFPILKEKFNLILSQLQHWVQQTFGLAITKQVQLINEALDNSKSLLGKTVGTALGTVIVILILPVYVFLLLFYKTLILNFLYEVFAEENSKKVSDVLNQTKSAIQSYMVGLLLEAIIVAVLNSTALLLLGVNYAILLGVIGAILNVLPYIGGIIAIALPVLIATVTKDGFSTQLGILAAYAIIQFIDNNFLVPKIVSSKVQINALVSIVIVLLGNAAWGIPGMFLSIPFVAVLKIIFDRVDGLRPWGKMLGDTVPTKHKGEIWPRRRKKVSVAEEVVEDTK
ncbi:MAG: AI-2E family transporter [Ginsengibacter sp.]